MIFTGLVKGEVSIEEIVSKLREHGCDEDTVISVAPIKRWNDIATTFYAEATDENARFLDMAIHRWFGEDGTVPFPVGALLHFSY